MHTEHYTGKNYYLWFRVMVKILYQRMTTFMRLTKELP